MADQTGVMTLGLGQDAGKPAAAPAACLSCVDRRTLLTGAAGLLGVAAGVAASRDRAAAAPAGRWQTLGPASDVPVGSGAYYPHHGNRTVVTQPREGVFRAFTGYCPHQGGELEQFPGRLIQCSSHGSQFRIGSGRVVRGPATQPLGRKEVRVRNGNVQIR